MSTECEKTNSCLDKIALGNPLEQNEKRLFEQHLHHCPLCKNRAQQLQSLSSQLQNTFQQLVCQFHSPKQKILQKLPKPPQQLTLPSPKKWRRILLAYTLLTLTMLCLIFAGLLIGYTLQKQKMQTKCKKLLQSWEEYFLQFYQKYKYLPQHWPQPWTPKQLDPWGKPLILKKISSKQLLLYSFGPNQIDNHGQNDDISISIQIP